MMGYQMRSLLGIEIEGLRNVSQVFGPSERNIRHWKWMR